MVKKNPTQKKMIHFRLGMIINWQSIKQGHH